MDTAGGLVLLDFWATWCAPCIEKIPNLAAIHDKFSARKDFVLIGVSLDGDQEALRGFVSKRRMKWPQVVGDAAFEAAQRFGVSGVPALFAIGAEGKILAATDGRSVSIQWVEELLKANSSK